MFRYCIKLYSGRVFKTSSDTESNLPRENKYIQVLGFETNKHSGYSFYDLDKVDLNELKGTKLVLINYRGLIHKPANKVKEVWKEKL